MLQLRIVSILTQWIHKLISITEVYNFCTLILKLFTILQKMQQQESSPSHDHQENNTTPPTTNDETTSVDELNTTTSTEISTTNTSSKLIRYVMDYMNEIKTKPQNMILECEEKSLKVLETDHGFKYLMKRMDGKEELEEAFFIEYLEKYCSGMELII